MDSPLISARASSKDDSSLCCHREKKSESSPLPFANHRASIPLLHFLSQAGNQSVHASTRAPAWGHRHCLFTRGKHGAPRLPPVPHCTRPGTRFYTPRPRHLHHTNLRNPVQHIHRLFPLTGRPRTQKPLTVCWPWCSVWRKAGEGKYCGT